MSAYNGLKGDIYVAAGAGTAFTNEATTSGDRITYTISNAAKKYWSPSTPVVVEVSPNGTDWSVITAGFELAYAGGKVIFPVAQPVGTEIRVDGGYLTPSQLAEGHKWSLRISQERFDASKFGDVWKAPMIAIMGAEVSLEHWWVDNYFLDKITNQHDCILVLYVDQSAGKRYECMGRITGDAIDVARAAAINEPLTFAIDGRVTYVAS